MFWGDSQKKSMYGVQTSHVNAESNVLEATKVNGHAFFGEESQSPPSVTKFCEIVAYHLEVSNTPKFLENYSKILRRS